MYLLKVKYPFILVTNAEPLEGQTTDFKVGDVIQVTNLQRTKGGFKTGIPVKTVNGWETHFTQSSNLSIVEVCGINEGESASDECISPDTVVIDNEQEAGEEAPVGSTGSTLAKAAMVIGSVYILSKL